MLADVAPGMFLSDVSLGVVLECSRAQKSWPGRKVKGRAKFG
jgi:hypothetical protein